jgi:transcriptional regulator with XRE-family HTH domain
MWFQLHTINSFVSSTMAKKGILTSFGDKVRLIRKELELSQEELADKAGLHRTYIGMIERGEKNITLTNVEKIAKALGLDISELLKIKHESGVRK